MKRKFIEVKDSGLIVCDNPKCKYELDIKGWPLEYFIDEPCPLCDENLLAKEDYLLHERMMKIINWLNKWFSWTMYFVPKKRWENNRDTVSAHFHDGVKIRKEP